MGWGAVRLLVTRRPHHQRNGLRENSGPGIESWSLNFLPQTRGSNERSALNFLFASRRRGGSPPPHPMTGAEREEDDGLCSVCMTLPRAVRLRPCGHASSCAQCSVRLVDARTRRLPCPLCKAFATQCEWHEGAAATAATAAPMPATAPELLARLTNPFSGVGRVAVAPALLRLSTFESASSRAALTVEAFVQAAAASDHTDGELRSHATKLLATWALHGDDVEALHRAAEEGDLDEVGGRGGWARWAERSPRR